MATSTKLPIFLFLLLLVSCSLLNAKTTPTPNPKLAFIFPIKKDNTTNQYYTRVQIGSNNTTLNVVIDLGGKFLWFDDVGYLKAVSSYYRPILCGTRQCKVADAVGCANCADGPPAPRCADNSCSDYAVNPFTSGVGYAGLGHDLLRLHSTTGKQYKINSFTLQFSNAGLRSGLASPAAGVIGLARGGISVQAQLASAFNISQKFALCIPPSGYNGNLIIGEAVYKKPFTIISRSLFSTPLVKNPVSTTPNNVVGNLTIEYFINVKSIRVGGTSLALNKTLLSIDKKTGGGGTSIRTVRAYTTLHRSIYRALVNEFVKAAARKSIKRVASVAPFGACFDAETIASSKTGPDVPVIDLVLQTSSIYWRFYGSNSMVRVGKNVMCLAFVEVQRVEEGPTTSIQVGGYQMENYLVEFDVVKSRLGFSSSLLLHDTSCSKFGAA